MSNANNKEQANRSETSPPKPDRAKIAAGLGRAAVNATKKK